MPIWDVSTAGSGLTLCVTTLAPASLLFNMVVEVTCFEAHRKLVTLQVIEIERK